MKKKVVQRRIKKLNGRSRYRLTKREKINKFKEKVNEAIHLLKIKNTKTDL